MSNLKLKVMKKETELTKEDVLNKMNEFSDVYEAIEYVLGVFNIVQDYSEEELDISEEELDIIDEAVFEFIKRKAGLYDNVPEAYRENVWKLALYEGLFDQYEEMIEDYSEIYERLVELIGKIFIVQKD